MFQHLGNAVSRFWPLVILFWVILLAVLLSVAPEWDDVTQDGEFTFLPDDVDSRRAEEVFDQAFPNDLLSSSVVVVVRREGPEGLREEDWEFVSQVLKPALVKIAQEEGGLAEDEESFEEDAEATDESAEPSTTEPSQEERPVVARIRTSEVSHVGKLLDSPDGKATLVVLDLTTEFLDRRNFPIIEKVEKLVEDLSFGTSPAVKHLESTVDDFVEEKIDVAEFRSQIGQHFQALSGERRHDPQNVEQLRELVDRIQDDAETSLEIAEEMAALLPSLRGTPPGLDLSFSGTATVGRDMRFAAKESADATELWTIVLVMTLLIIIYRAPILSLIPLATVATSVAISLCLLALLSQRGLVELFAGIEIYTTVLVYGAGVDYCLFLIARYKEELDNGCTFGDAVSNALGRVGAALAASAGTTICGIGMMVFADFGKFQQAGVAITFSLAVCLSAALTLTPALLRMTGRWAFWPNAPQDHAQGGWISATSLIATLMDRLTVRSMWTRVGRALLAHPGKIWLASVGLMLPFAVVCVMFYSHLTYGLLDELPESDASVVGARAVQEHFPAGSTGIVKILIQHDDIDFNSRTEGAPVIKQLTELLYEKKEQLGIASVRSLTHPLGTDEGILKGGSRLSLPQRLQYEKSRRYYVSDAAGFAGRVTRLEVVFDDDPFSRNSIAQFEKLKTAVAAGMKEVPELEGAQQPYFVGPTASIRDLKLTTDRDQIVIDILVPLGVFAILVLLLRRPAISAYLIVSVLFSYLVTLGVTFAVFYALDPAGFPGLDWKVPMFLFTILIAVGEDYNIYLMTRIGEEQANHGRVKGVTVALEKTGSIISSCGFIMAGTFSSLLAGSLVGMHQLGFALAFGVLLDTFVVRPVLVPAYLIMLYQGRFGALGKLLGAGGHEPVASTKPATEPQDLPAPEAGSAAKSA